MLKEIYYFTKSMLNTKAILNELSLDNLTHFYVRRVIEMKEKYLKRKNI